MRCLLRVLLTTVTLLVLTAGPASAHANLLTFTPADSAVLTQAPDELTLSYDQPVGTSLGAVRLLDPAGANIATGPVGTRDGGRTVFVAITQPTMAPGTYTVLWRVLSQDSHTISGASTFSIGKASATSVTAERSGDGGPAKDLLDVTRFLLYGGIALLIGGTAFLLVLWPRGWQVRTARAVPRTGLLLALIGTGGGLLLQGPYASGRPVTSLFDPELVSTVIGTRYGVAALVRLLLLFVAAGVLVALPRWRVGAGIIGAGILFTVAFTGHAGSGSLTVLALIADMLHLGAMSAWLGGLALLGVVVLRRPEADLEVLLPRWSRYAAWAVGVLVVSGTFAGWREVREPGALTGTGYGRLLILKVALVVAMVGLGAWGRAWIQRTHHRRRPDAGPVSPVDGVPVVGATATAGARQRVLVDDRFTSVPTRSFPTPGTGLRRSVLLETALATTVLAVTAVLVASVPAREAYSPTFTQSAQVAADRLMQVRVAPARAGLNDLEVTYTGAGGTPVDVVAVTARWQRGDSSDVVPVTPARTTTGHYEKLRVALPSAGTWKLTVTTQTSDIDSTSILFTVRVR